MIYYRHSGEFILTYTIICQLEGQTQTQTNLKAVHDGLCLKPQFQNLMMMIRLNRLVTVLLRVEFSGVSKIIDLLATRPRVSASGL
jgi:hypothetical protein